MTARLASVGFRRSALGLGLSVALLGCSGKDEAASSRIAFVIERQGTKSDILLVDPQGGEPVPVAPADSEDEAPSWSPDALTLIFTSKRDGHYGLYTWERNLEMV